MLDRRFIDINLIVNNIANSPDDNPAIGTQYIIGSSPTGAFAGATENYIARYDGATWKFTPPKAGSFEILNITTGEILKYNGTAWTAVTSLSGGSGNSYIPVAPVLDIIPTGTNLPVSATEGDKFLKTDDAKLYTATATDTWDAGVITANGTRYASSTNYKIYESNGSEVTASNIANGDIFLNKADNHAYIYDGINFIDITSLINESKANETIETHVLTDSEVIAKSFTLSNNIKTNKEAKVLLSFSGTLLVYGIDFYASGNIINWNGKGLENFAPTAGDVFTIQYLI